MNIFKSLAVKDLEAATRAIPIIDFGPAFRGEPGGLEDPGGDTDAEADEESDGDGGDDGDDSVSDDPSDEQEDEGQGTTVHVSPYGALNRPVRYSRLTRAASRRRPPRRPAPRSPR